MAKGMSGRRVLITGASGRVAREIRPLLAERYRFRLLQRPGEPALAGTGRDDEIVVGDILSAADMRRAVEGVDAVIHLAAAVSMTAPWDDALNLNVAGTYNVLEAMRAAGVRRLVHASSNHATGFWETVGAGCDSATPLRGDSYYGASKAMSEILVRLYVDLHGISAICLRIGSFRKEPEDARQLSTWISPRDLAQMVWRAIESPLDWGVFYGISGNTRRYWDIGAAMDQLGYRPEDDAEAFAHRFDTTT
ncbi:MAG: NAD-dependent epimerase/dehydratase family protein [Reyranellaceae bacterium]